jgi:hypothetical protein
MKIKCTGKTAQQKQNIAISSHGVFRKVNNKLPNEHETKTRIAPYHELLHIYFFNTNHDDTLRLEHDGYILRTEIAYRKASSCAINQHKKYDQEMSCTHGRTPARFPANPEYKPFHSIRLPPRAACADHKLKTANSNMPVNNKQKKMDSFRKLKA